MKTAKTIQERLAQIPDSHKAKMMFLKKKRENQEKKHRLKKILNSLFDIMLTLGRVLFVWIIIFIPFVLSISILSKHNIITKYADNKSVYHIGWIIFLFSCIYGVKTHLLLRKFKNRKEK